MDQSHSKIPSCTRNSQILFNTPSTSNQVDSGPPSTARSRSKILESIQNRPWSHIFRTPVSSSEMSLSTTQSTEISTSVDSAVDLSAYANYQTRILRTTEELNKRIDNISSTITQDKEKLETGMKNLTGLIESVREESHARNEQLTNSSTPTLGMLS